MTIPQLRDTLRRRAIRMQVGGFRPPDSPSASWFGRASLALPGESWPTTEGRAMHALCQINTTELPFRPAGLEDVELVTVFVGPSELPDDTPNGVSWCLRAYPRLDALVPLAAAATGSPIRAFPMSPEVVENDFPCMDDVAIPLPAGVEDRYEELFPNTGGIKLGGWPTLVQGEVDWGRRASPDAPRYVFQVDSVEKAGWSWGDMGVGYFGRGTAPGRAGEWALSWQCY
ncbi:MAG TPA: DUF1963 domain-containing protein [Longimicrobiaceae bacterium]